MADPDPCHEYCLPENMLLDPDKVNLKELCLLLFSINIGARKFINSHNEEELQGNFVHRLYIFICVVAIKALKSISKFMNSLGSAIESWLNLWTYYDSFFLLIFNKLRGKKVELNRNLPDFVSVIGLTDTRLDLDDEITREDPRYNSALAIMAAKTAYENPARVKKIVQEHWKMEFLGFYNCFNAYEKKYSTQAFMFSDKTGDHELICVSFRGTSPFSANDWCTDLDLSWYHLPGIGKIHAGFLKALGLQKCENGCASYPKELKEHEEDFAYYKIRKVLRQKLKKNKKAKFIVTGHSLGGALAALFPTILAFHNEHELLEKLKGVFTFGQPRVGDDEFCKSMEKVLGLRYFRFVYGNDIVPRIPFDNHDLLFKHFGRCYYFDVLYRGQIMNEEPNKNYFSMKWIVPKHLFAIFEMIRSFVMPYAYGKNYREGILLLAVRSFGLLVPGASAHCPQDYVNLTRLGSPDTFNALQLDDYDE